MYQKTEIVYFQIHYKYKITNYITQKYLEKSYTIFSDFSFKNQIIYGLIRPGRTVNDPVVTDFEGI